MVNRAGCKLTRSPAAEPRTPGGESRSAVWYTSRMKQNGIAALVVLIAAAALEVGGDAIIRKGLRGAALPVVALGFAVLGSYGVVVNLLQIDFSRLLGVYVGVFALVSVLAGAILFRERIASATWIGLAVILAGSAIIQFGGAAR
jgi:drug/metabolite transporter superfamily protein YnfA